MHSARKVKGRPLYLSARQGKELKRQGRQTHVHELRLLAVNTDTARIFVRCDAGTYVRTLCEQLGSLMDLPAHMGPLLRIEAGPFVLRDAVLPAQIESEGWSHVVNPLAVLRQAVIELNETQLQRFLQGNIVTGIAEDAAEAERPVLVVHAGRLFGTARVSQRRLEPQRVFS